MNPIVILWIAVIVNVATIALMSRRLDGNIDCLEAKILHMQKQITELIERADGLGGQESE